MDFKLILDYRVKGQPVQNYEMFARAWDECIELQQSPKDEWVGRSILTMQELYRYELGAIVDGQTVGGMVLALDPWDPHVGDCMSIFTQYVLPEFRNKRISAKFMRKAIEIAKTDGMHTLAYTHRKGPWRYETIYKRI